MAGGHLGLAVPRLAGRVLPGEAPLWATTDWGYLRLHHGSPDWAYSDDALQRWATELRAAFAEGYAYANNDPGAAAPRDALRLRELLNR